MSRVALERYNDMFTLVLVQVYKYIIHISFQFQLPVVRKLFDLYFFKNASSTFRYLYLTYLKFMPCYKCYIVTRLGVLLK